MEWVLFVWTAAYFGVNLEMHTFSSQDTCQAAVVRVMDKKNNSRFTYYNEQTYRKDSLIWDAYCMKK